MKSFSHVIFKVGINPCVVPPPEVMEYVFRQAKKRSGAIPVRGTINGAQYMQTLVKYDGHWRLYVNGLMLKASKRRVNDVASFTIEFDPRDRTILPHPDFAAALKKDTVAATAFDLLAPSRRKEINRYLNALKRDTIRTRNIERVVDFLSGRKTRNALAVLRPAKRPAKRIAKRAAKKRSSKKRA